MNWKKLLLCIAILINIYSLGSNVFAEYKPLTDKELEELTISVTKLLESDTNEFNIQQNINELSLLLNRTRRSLSTEAQFYTFSKPKIFGRTATFLNAAIDVSLELKLTLLSDHLKSLSASPINSPTLVNIKLTDLNNIRMAIHISIQPGIPNLFG